MQPDPRFLKHPQTFWAYVRSISQALGYTRGKLVSVPTVEQIAVALQVLDLASHPVFRKSGAPTRFGQLLLDYFEHRATILNNTVQFSLMNSEQARKEFETVVNSYSPTRRITMNKQKAAMRAPAYLTGIVNTLIEANAEGFACDYDPQQLTTVTRERLPLRTLARRVDGAFTNAVNPIAIWEIKEYYYTTSFGSRIADGIYESLLDGMELKELNEEEGVHVKHYLIVDAYLTWWGMGKSYLCRIVDMLHMGYIDEALFGREVLDRLPIIVKGWVAEARARGLTPERANDVGAVQAKPNLKPPRSRQVKGVSSGPLTSKRRK